MPETSGLVLGGMARLLELLGGVLDRLDDVDVAGAAAEVAGDRLADVGLGRIGVLREQRAAGHHHAWRAVAALEPVLLPEALLDRVELVVFLQTLDGGGLAAAG